MVQIRIQGTKHELALLTKAARHTGLATPNRFLAALFDGNHPSPFKQKTDSSSGRDAMTSSRLKP
jgi:hypothetical protein